MIPLKTVEEIIIRHSSLEKDLSSGGLDKKLFAEKSKEYSDLNEIIINAKDYISFQSEKEKLENILNDSSTDEELIKMDFVDAVFYFKDGTELIVYSEKGIYNNKTLDMKFDGNVIAKYEGSELFAQKAEYSNSKSFLMISNNVKVKDYRGTMFADKLFFDIKKQTLNIASTKDGKVNANINLK